jgi:L-serine dehydratase
MGPLRAAQRFALRIADKAARRVSVELYGSIAATGRGHQTDRAIQRGLDRLDVAIQWRDGDSLSHPNGMIFRAFDEKDAEVDSWEVYSVGGGCLADKSGPLQRDDWESYPFDNLADVLAWSQANDRPMWACAEEHEGPEVWNFLAEVWNTMRESVERGLNSEMDVLPGSLKLRRRGRAMREQANNSVGFLRYMHLVSSYALSVAEENAAGELIVTAPTCGAAGVVPAVLYYFWKHAGAHEEDILHALATAGLVGSVVARNASISGAEVGCQGEIGTACAMASACAAQLLKGSLLQIEYAAEMGLEHWLGLTCDPVDGLVQVPCIERNGFAAMRAMECSAYAIATCGEHLVTFDQVVAVMNQTGRDLQSKYRETATGGLASIMAAVLHGE